MLGRLKKCIERRIHLSLPPELYRLCDGVGDELPGIYIDRFGSSLLVHLLDGECDVKDSAAAFRADAAQICEMTNVRAMYLRVHGSDARGTAAHQAELLFGDLTAEFVVDEVGAKFKVNPADQTNAGLFLDMRDVRALLRQTSRDLKVLNTFCFTGSLGVAAGLGQAREVVQVDVSGSVLGWAKRNWELNLPDPKTRMRLIKEDSGEFIAKELRRIERGAEPYDLIILDPPSYGSSKGKRFSIERDFARLIESSHQILGSTGRMIVTTNNSNLSVDGVLAIIKESIGSSIVSHKPLLPPADFTSTGYRSHAMRGVLVEARSRSNA